MSKVEIGKANNPVLHCRTGSQRPTLEPIHHNNRSRRQPSAHSSTTNLSSYHSLRFVNTSNLITPQQSIAYQPAPTKIQPLSYHTTTVKHVVSCQPTAPQPILQPLHWKSQPLSYHTTTIDRLSTGTHENSTTELSHHNSQARRQLSAHSSTTNLSSYHNLRFVNTSNRCTGRVNH
nr:hypothetical protein MACL_00002918 [Theileria orientalis]